MNDDELYAALSESFDEELRRVQGLQAALRSVAAWLRDEPEALKESPHRLAKLCDSWAEDDEIRAADFEPKPLPFFTGFRQPRPVP